jgi:hypothetical protein
MDMTVSARELLRHSLATIAYRTGKTLRGTPESFADFKAADSARTPVQILAHMGDLFDWSLSMVQGKQVWKDSKPLPWAQEIDRFFASLQKLDDYLCGEEKVHAPLDKLFQGPVADALNHAGQLAILRRIAGIPIGAENYYVAEIAIGRVGKEQAAPKREF